MAKYRANAQDTWKELRIKALDSMPVGTMVEFAGGTIPAGWTQVNDYSTDEIDTGKTWIDGKEIYRKVLNVANLNASTLKLAHGITNVGVPINIYGYLTRSDGGSKTFPFPKIDPNSSAWSIGFESFDATDISFSIGASLVSKINGGYLVIEYTKTTNQE